MKKGMFFTVVAALVVWSFVSHLALPLCVAVSAMVIWGFHSDRNMWKTKPNAELVAMVESAKWRYWQTALEELRRRGEDISPFTPRLVAGLVSDSIMARTASESTLKALFPEFKEHLKDYRPTQDVALSRKKLEKVLVTYGI